MEFSDEKFEDAVRSLRKPAFQFSIGQEVHHRVYKINGCVVSQALRNDGIGFYVIYLFEAYTDGQILSEWTKEEYLNGGHRCD